MINFSSYTKTALSVLALSLLSVNSVLAQSKPVSVPELAQSTTTETPAPSEIPQMEKSPVLPKIPQIEKSPVLPQIPQMGKSPVPSQTPNNEQTNTDAQQKTPEITIDPPLTAQQEKKLKSIKNKYDKQIKSAANNYIKSVKEFQKLFGTNPSNDKIRTRYKKAQKAKEELNDLLLERSLEYRSVLTTQQKQSLVKSIEKLINTK